MTSDHTELLRVDGDPVEQAILTEASGLDGIVSPYAKIWALQIQPRRDARKRYVADERWYEFGSHHYTALLRTWNAHQAKCSIAESYLRLADEPRDGRALLQLHNVVASAWEGLGAAIDNLEKALLVLHPTALTIKTDKLSECYERRSQSIHSVVSPIIAEDGTVSVYMSHMKGSMKWHHDRRDLRDAASWMDSEWRATLNQLASAWERIAATALNEPRPTTTRDDSSTYSHDTLPLDTGMTAVSGCYLPPGAFT